MSSEIELIKKDLEWLKKELLEIKEHFGITTTENTKTSREIPPDYKTVLGIYDLISHYRLNRKRVFTKQQKFPNSLLKFSLIAIIKGIIQERDLATNRPEKILLEDKDGKAKIKINNWHTKTENLLKNYLEKEIVFFDIALNPVSDDFMEKDGNWILNWSGEFFEKRRGENE